MTDFKNDAIEKFLKQIKTANDFNSKELRISIKDAESLALGITMLLSAGLGLSQEVILLQKRLIDQMNQTPPSINLNGGSF